MGPCTNIRWRAWLLGAALAASVTTAFVSPTCRLCARSRSTSPHLYGREARRRRLGAEVTMAAPGGGRGGGKKPGGRKEAGSGGGGRRFGGGGSESREQKLQKFKSQWSSNFGPRPPGEEDVKGSVQKPGGKKDVGGGSGEKGRTGKRGGPSTVVPPSNLQPGQLPKLSNQMLKRLSPAGRQNPVLRMILAKHPEILDKSVDELERDLDGKFDRVVKQKGLEYFYAEEDEEERKRAEARLAPMSGDVDAKQAASIRTDAVIRSQVEDIDDEISPGALRELGLEVEPEDEEGDLKEEYEDADAARSWIDSLDEKEVDEMLKATEEGVPLPKLGFKLRPPPLVEHDDEASDEGEEERPSVKRKAKEAGEGQPDEEFADRNKWAMETEEEKPLTGPSKEGGDLRFRKGNLFSVQNIRHDSGVLRADQSFAGLGITDVDFLANLENMGVKVPTKIQASAIPRLVEGKDAVLHSYTGSGKTLAYLLPLLSRVSREETHVQLVVLAPSRELATQIAAVANKVTEGTGISCLSLIGGASVDRQVEKLREARPRVLVGTPGRVAELVLDRRKARIGRAPMLVLDEVDLLLDRSYYGDVRMVAQAMGSLQHAVFASATGRSEGVMALADALMDSDYETIGTGTEEDQDKSSIELPTSIRHGVFITPPAKSMDALRRLLNTEPAPESVMVFVSDTSKVERVIDFLNEKGIDAGGLSGESSRSDRALVLARLTSGKLRVAVTTDVAARGIDVPMLTHVVNLDLPSSLEQYVHRAGRCGRAGRPGIVLSFSPPSTGFVLEKWAKRVGVTMDRVDLAHGRVILFDGADLPQPGPSRRAQRAGVVSHSGSIDSEGSEDNDGREEHTAEEETTVEGA